ncbi:MAG: hypothetical protein QOC65_58 [Sphingomonadales bacterium]|nr:hypothetical protein [Sphingomonadales bacterium]
MDPYLGVDLIPPVLAMAAGAALLFFPRHYRRQAQRRHRERLAELDAGAAERFFEERRSLEAYRPARSDVAWQCLGVLFFLAGAFPTFILLTR